MRNIFIILATILLTTIVVKASFILLEGSKIPVIGSTHVINWSRTDDPFSKPMFDTLTVIDYKQGYVLYKSNRWNQITSTRLKTFNYLIQEEN
jgi:hypothetical protein